MDDLLALDGGGAATKWQKQHAKRKKAAASKKARIAFRAEQRADLKKRLKKWRAKKAAAKLAGLPFSNHSRPRDIRKPQWTDMTGWKFGRLTVLRIAPVSSNGKNHGRRWWVKCDCGSGEKRVAGTNLRQGILKSCGCLVRERIRETAKRQAEQRRKLAAAPLSIQVAELRQRIFKKLRIVRRDIRLLDAVRRILVQEEVRQGVRKCGKSGRPMLVMPAGVKGAHGGRLTGPTVH